MFTRAVAVSTSLRLVTASKGITLIGYTAVKTWVEVMRLVAGMSVAAMTTCRVSTVGWGPAEGGGSVSWRMMPVRIKTTAAAATAARRPVSTSKSAVRFCFNYELLADNID